jgi:hypothetical protein
MPDLGGFATATLLGDGTVLTTFALRDAEVFDPTNESWTYVGTGDTTFRLGATGTLLGNGTVLLAGGQDAAGQTSPDAQLYHPGVP